MTRTPVLAVGIPTDKPEGVKGARQSIPDRSIQSGKELHGLEIPVEDFGCSLLIDEWFNALISKFACFK